MNKSNNKMNIIDRYIATVSRKNRKNIFMSVVLVIAVFLTIVGIKFGIKALVIHSENKQKEIMSSLDFKAVYVSKGDTAYNLQLELISNSEDVREMLFYASKYNDKALDQLQAGEIIYLVNSKHE